MVDEPVDHGGSDDVVGEDLAPPAEGHVRGHKYRALLVAGCDELEEQVRGIGGACNSNFTNTAAESATLFTCPGAPGRPARIYFLTALPADSSTAKAPHSGSGTSATSSPLASSKTEASDHGRPL